MKLREDLQSDNGHQGDAVKCTNCGRDEYEAAVFPVRIKGSDTWVCARCLPGLIHG